MKLAELSVFTDAIHETAAFYEQLLGLPPAYRGEGIAIFETSEFQVVVHRIYTPGPGELPPDSHVGFSVEELDAKIHALEEHGVVIDYPPREYDWGRSAYLRDPAGNLIELKDSRVP
jgi:catechol 2,3-dioxygenase-like lactoylglutathione lyase family enzyme